jgi:hypothetical protein
MPWEEFSFLFNSPTSSKKGDAHGIGLTGDMGEGLVKYLFLEISGAPTWVHENRRERIIFLPGRTHNRSRFPR